MSKPARRKQNKPLDRRNRANAKDRPEKAHQCRQGDPLVSRCNPMSRFFEGHTFMFHRGDRYGWCKHCGAEVLT